MNKIDFTNKVVIVTGASSGIGAEAARTFARYGATLSLIGRNEERLLKVAVDCQTINGLAPLWMLLDLTQQGSCELLVAKTVETFGKIDVLVNCAGKVKTATVFNLDMNVFDELMDINLRVPCLLSKLVLPHLTKTKGNIVNIGSAPCSRHRKGFVSYALTKTSIQKFTEHAAVEMAEVGVRINCVNPGITRTNIMSNLNIEPRKQQLVYETFEKKRGKIIEPKEVALLICLTASGLFPNLNGSGINLDGATSLT